MTRLAYMVQDRLAGIIQWWRDWSFGLKGARAEWDSYRQLASRSRVNPMPKEAPNGFAILEKGE